VLRTIVVVVPLLVGLAACGESESAKSGGAGTATAGDTTSIDLRAGDPARGKEVYAASGCGACHTFTPAGSARNVGPNLDEAAELYPPEFLLESIVDPTAYVEKGSSGSIGGDREYGTEMPAYGPDEKPPGKLTEQQLADLVAFLESG
jgi:mono/diheme cytochrome c family protein